MKDAVEFCNGDSRPKSGTDIVPPLKSASGNGQRTMVRVGGDFDNPTYSIQDTAFLAANPMSDRQNMVLESTPTSTGSVGEKLPPLTLFAVDSLAKTSRWLDAVLDWLGQGPDYGSNSIVALRSLLPVGFSSRTSLAFYQATKAAIWPLSSGGWRNSGMGGPTGYLTLNTLEWPKDAAVCSLSEVLEDQPVPQRYFLSPKAAQGILRRAARRGRELPTALMRALQALAGENPGGGSSVVGTLKSGGDTKRGWKVDAESAADGHLIVGGGSFPTITEESPPLTGRNGDRTAVLGFDLAQVTSDKNYSNPKPGDPQPPLNTVAQGMVAFQQNTRDEVRLMGGDGEIAGALAAQPGMKQQNYIAHALSSEGADASEDGTGRGTPLVAAPLRGFGHGWQGQHNDDAAQAGLVRRLTPTECERLQGFPDGWTDVAGAADSTRYRQLGNAVAVPVAEWIGRRLATVAERTPE